jgi:hypothetical protein
MTPSRVITLGADATRTAATSPSRTVPPLGVSILDARQARPQLGDSPDDDLEHLLVFEEQADLEARQQRRRGSPDVAGLDPVLLGGGKVDLDLDRRLLAAQPDRRVDDAVDAGHCLPHLLGPIAERRQVLPVDAYGYVRFGSGQDLVDSLLGICGKR